MKNLTKLTAAVLALFGFGANAMVNVDALVAASVCTGDGAVCNQTVTNIKGGGGAPLGAIGGLLNAIAEEEGAFAADTAVVDVTDLGKIDSDRTEDIKISAKNGDYKIYSYVPAKTGKKTFAAFKSEVPAAGKPGAGTLNVTIFRQIEGEPSTLWTWRAGYPINLKKVKPVDGAVTQSFKIGTDGNVQDQVGNKFAVAS